MDMQQLKKLPLSVTDFNILRNDNAIYVDKTDLIYKIVENRGPYFFNRPRRFGKTLLLSTIESLFRDGLKNFGDLKISKLWKDKTYKVLKLDFSRAKDFNSIDDFLIQCWNMFRIGCKRGGINFTSAKGEKIGEMLDSIIIELDQLSLVLLIDEYDAPLTSTLDNPDLFQKVRTHLSNFYSIVKSSNDIFRFILLTGITKFNKSSIFSGLNDLIDISLQKNYSTLLGYTEEEIIYYFDDYIINASNIHGVQKEDIIDRMKIQYDGFCFDEEASNHVFSPWSVLNFLAYPSRYFKNYWYDSSGMPSILSKYFTTHKPFTAKRYEEKRIVSLNSLQTSNDIDTIQETVLLVQTGYLTIKERKENYFVVGYPNVEVASSMALLSMYVMLRGRNVEEVGLIDIRQRLSVNDPKDIVDLFNSCLLYVPYEQYPISSEAMCRALVLVLLAGAEVFPVAERTHALGRSDLEVSVGGIHWVFEFKFLANGKTQESLSLPKQKFLDSEEADEVSKIVNLIRPAEDRAINLLASALDQIRLKKYGDIPNKSATVVKMALVFSQQDRQFVDWETFPLSKRTDAPLRDGWAQKLARELERKNWTKDMLAPLFAL